MTDRLVENQLAIIIFSKNEIRNIAKCIDSCQRFPNIFVVDSDSSDGTQDVAKSLGAKVIDFQWNGQYPRKKQWSIEHFASFEWLLLLDADERVTENYLREVFAVLSIPNLGAAKTQFTYKFLGRNLRFGHKVTKVNLVKSKKCYFPNLESNLPGNGDIEMHYQPIVQGRIVKLRNRIVHDDQDPLVSWVRRHVLYAELEATLNCDRERRNQTFAMRSLGGRIFARIPFKPIVFFIYSYFLRFGFLDFRPGLLYSLYLSWYYSLISAIKLDTKHV